jgi:alpha-L-rhamnosidase
VTDSHAPLERTTQALIVPEAITLVEGRVQKADALIHGGRTTLSADHEAVATVVVDYGRIVGGLPVFEVEAFSGAPVLTAIYSQALPWLMPDGDGPAPGKPGATGAAPKEVSFVGFAGGANLSRMERVALRTGRIVNRLVQGGQRFQALRVSGTGSVSLSKVGFLPTFNRRSRQNNQGSFSCSDETLSEIWSLGAYALDVASLPAGAVPALWDIGPDGATVYGDTYTGYQRGLAWTDYSTRFEVRIIANEAAWLVRAQPPDGIRFVLCAATDRLLHSTPNTLRVYVQFRQQPIATMPLPMTLREGEWHTVETAVKGASITVAIDGRPIGMVRIPVEGGFWGSTAAGWLAFANASGAIATFRNLHVAAADGATLLSTPLTDPAILDEFAAGKSTRSTILDGATRDRLLFTGDLGVAARTLVYTNFDLPYLTDSIGLFSYYQSTEGAIPTSIPPQANPGRTPGNAFAAGIPDYTVHHVTTIHTYWMHSGDREFLRAQWPVVQRVLGYLRASTDSGTGLFASVRRGNPPIADTLTNAHYYGALRQAASMAEALGDLAEARTLNGLAQRLRQAIDQHLFNRKLGLYGASTHDLDTVVEHANAYAVLYQVPDEDRIPGILAQLAAALHRSAGPMRSTGPDGSIVSPYTAGYEVAARFEAGDTTMALDLIRSAWRPMRKGAPFTAARPGSMSASMDVQVWAAEPASPIPGPAAPPAHCPPTCWACAR